MGALFYASMSIVMPDLNSTGRIVKLSAIPLPSTGSTDRLVSWIHIAAKLTRDGRLAPVQQMGDLRDGFALSKKKEYLFLLKWCKMYIVAYRLFFCYR